MLLRITSFKFRVRVPFRVRTCVSYAPMSIGVRMLTCFHWYDTRSPHSFGDLTICSFRATISNFFHSSNDSSMKMECAIVHQSIAIYWNWSTISAKWAKALSSSIRFCDEFHDSKFSMKWNERWENTYKCKSHEYNRTAPCRLSVGEVWRQVKVLHSCQPFNCIKTSETFENACHEQSTTLTQKLWHTATAAAYAWQPMDGALKCFTSEWARTYGARKKWWKVNEGAGDGGRRGTYR